MWDAAYAKEVFAALTCRLRDKRQETIGKPLGKGKNIMQGALTLEHLVTGLTVAVLLVGILILMLTVFIE